MLRHVSHLTMKIETNPPEPNLSSFFDLFDRWRHYPAYRLEPRVDIYFAFFLPEVLDLHLSPRGTRVDPRLVPEFPIRQRGTKRSDKADFFALSLDKRHAFLVELKTDVRSLNDRQEEYLMRAVDRGLTSLLSDVRAMARSPVRYIRRKYFHLLQALEGLGLVELPSGLDEKIHGKSRGVYGMIDAIEIRANASKLEVIHVLPKQERGKNTIDFCCFAEAVEQRGDVGRRFADSLRKWRDTPAGNRGDLCG